MTIFASLPMTHRHCPSPRHVHRGSSLLEVLIAVLIMAIGALGIAAMQATALRNTQSALERSQGVVYTYAILDAIRANMVNPLNGDRDAARAKLYNLARTCDVPAAGTTLVTNDQNAWIASMEGSLGTEACGSIACTDAAVCTVTVDWDDARGTGGDTQNPLTITTVSQL